MQQADAASALKAAQTWATFRSAQQTALDVHADETSNIIPLAAGFDAAGSQLLAE